MKSRFNFIITISLLFLVIIFAVNKADQSVDKLVISKASENFPTIEKKKNVSEPLNTIIDQFHTALEAHDYEAYLKAERTLFLYKASNNNEIRLLRKALIDSAEARSQFGLGEPLRALEIAASLISNDDIKSSQDSLRLAKLYLDIGMPLEAIPVLNPISKNSKEAHELLNRLHIFLKVIDKLSPSLNPPNHDPKLDLLRHLIAMPSNFTSDYLNALNNSAPHQINSNSGLQSLLKSQIKIDLSSIDIDPQSKDYKTQLVEPSISINDLVKQDFANTDISNRDAVRKIVEAESFLNSIIKASKTLRVKNHEVFQKINGKWKQTQLELSTIQYVGNGFVATFLGTQYSGEYCSVFVFVQPRKGILEGKAVITDSWLPKLEIVRPVAGEELKIFLNDRRSSGGYNTGVLFSLGGTPEWIYGALYHGKFSLVNLDGDDDLEIVASGASHFRLGSDCNQCPSKYTGVIFDYNHKSTRFEPRSVIETTAENNVWGMSNAFLNMDTETEVVRALDIVASIKNSKNIKPSVIKDNCRDVTVAIVRTFQNEDYTKAAELAEWVRNHARDYVNQDNDFYNIMWTATSWGSRALSRAGHPEMALQWASETWFAKSDGVDNEMRENRKNEINQLLGEIYLENRDLAGVLRQITTSPNSSPESFETEQKYWQIIGDSSSELVALSKKMDGFTVVAEQENTGEDLNSFNHWISVKHKRTKSIIEMALLLLRKNETDRAIHWIARSIPLARDQGGVEIAMANMAASIAANKLSSPLLAIRFLDDALPVINEKDWNEIGPIYLLTYGQSLEKIGKVDEALGLYISAGNLAKNSDPLLAATIFFEAAKLQLRRELKVEALSLLKEAITNIITAQHLAPTEQHKFITLENRETIFRNYLDIAFELSVPDDEVFEMIQKWKLQIFQEIYFKKISKVLPENKNQITSQLQSNLKQNEAVIDFYCSGKVCLASIITNESGVKIQRIDFSEDKLKEWASRIRESFDVRQSKNLGDFRGDIVSKSLEHDLMEGFSKLIKPLGLQSKINRLLISPSQSLYGIPWGALLDESKYLIEKYDVAVTPSLRQQVFYKHSTPSKFLSTDSALFIGAFSEVEASQIEKGGFGLATNEQPIKPLARLKYGDREIAAASNGIAFMDKINVITYPPDIIHSFDNTAKWSTHELLDEMSRHSLVHIVAHGLFNSFKPMESAIFLKGITKDEILKAKDFADLDFTNVKLITLAACQTATVSFATGSEPIGFVRSALGAGVNQILLTNWEVDDYASSELLSSFYKKLENKDTVTALAMAQRELISSHHHPYFWAGFTLYGAWY